MKTIYILLIGLFVATPSLADQSRSYINYCSFMGAGCVPTATAYCRQGGQFNPASYRDRTAVTECTLGADEVPNSKDKRVGLEGKWEYLSCKKSMLNCENGPYAGERLFRCSAAGKTAKSLPPSGYWHAGPVMAPLPGNNNIPRMYTCMAGQPPK